MCARCNSGFTMNAQRTSCINGADATDMPDGELASATDAAVAQAGLAIALCAPVFFQMFL